MEDFVLVSKEIGLLNVLLSGVKLSYGLWQDDLVSVLLKETRIREVGKISYDFIDIELSFTVEG